METGSALAAFALIALATAVTCLVRLHQLAPEVAPARDAVSDYGAGPHAGWYRTQVVSVGLAAAAIGLGLRAAGLGAGGVVWLYLFAAARVLIAGFPVDLPGSERTRTGVAHNLLATTAFASIAVAASTISADLVGDPTWRFDGSWFQWLGSLVVLAAVALAAAWVVPGLRRSAFGAVERCWYAATIAWLGLSAIGLLLS